MEMILVAVLSFAGGWFYHTPSALDCRNDALIVTSCPTLTRLDDPTLGGHVLKLQEVAGQYNECRRACVQPAKTAE